MMLHSVRVQIQLVSSYLTSLYTHAKWQSGKCVHFKELLANETSSFNQLGFSYLWRSRMFTISVISVEPPTRRFPISIRLQAKQTTI